MTEPSKVVENVSRETLARLGHYVALIEKWNKAINLVGKSTEQAIWDRHINDSLQLLPLIPEHIATAADLGSGAGLPGMVVAIAQPELAVTLVEQDQRKAAFLQETAAQLRLANVRVLNKDIFMIKETFELIMARALAPLTALCAMAFPLCEASTICLFPKGKNFAIEVAEARNRWNGHFQIIPSLTQQDSSIVSITELSQHSSGNS